MLFGIIKQDFKIKFIKQILFLLIILMNFNVFATDTGTGKTYLTDIIARSNPYFRGFNFTQTNSGGYQSGGIFNLYSYGAGDYSYLYFNYADLSGATPAYPDQWQTIGRIGFKGYNSNTAVFDEGAYIDIQPSQNWSSTVHGTVMELGVVVNDSLTTKNTLVMSGYDGGTTTIGSTLIIKKESRHILTQSSSTPTLTGCGTGATILSGSGDYTGQVHCGTGETACTITFHTAYADEPVCVVASKDGLNIDWDNDEESLTVGSTVDLSGTDFTYICTGR